MKYLILLLIPIVLFSCAPKPIAKMDYPKPFEFELIDTVSGTKDELYVKAHEFIARNFGSAKAVIDMQDKEAGKLIGKPLFYYENSIQNTRTGSHTFRDDVTYVISIDVKDGKYRCVVSDFNHKGGSYFTKQGMTYGTSYGDLNRDDYSAEKEFYGVKNAAMLHAQDILARLKNAMHTQPKDY